jgi:hypothetical protein
MEKKNVRINQPRLLRRLGKEFIRILLRLSFGLAQTRWSSRKNSDPMFRALNLRELSTVTGAGVNAI